MKTLLRWLVKKFITKQDIKNAVHAANARLAKREAGERAQTVMGWGEDASQIVATSKHTPTTARSTTRSAPCLTPSATR